MENAFADASIIELNNEIGLGGAKSGSMERDEKEESVSDLNKNYRSREINDVCERPSSLRLESVLEYTNRIKAFLGLQDEQNEPDNSTTDDKFQANASQENNSLNGVETDADRKLLVNKSINAENSQAKPEDLAPSKINEFMSSITILTLQPLPNIIGVQPDSLKEGERKELPDILGRSTNFENEKPEAVSENSPDIAVDKISEEVSVSSENNNDLQNLEANIVSPPNEIVCKEDTLSEIKSDAPDVKKKYVSDASNTEITQNNDNAPSFSGASEESEKAHNVPSFEQKPGQVIENDKLEDIQDEEDSSDSYQITHIEEGLRQAEKSLKSKLPPEPNEQQKLLKGVPQEPLEQQKMFKSVPQEPDEQQTILEDIPQESYDQQTMIDCVPQEEDVPQKQFKDDVNQDNSSDSNPTVSLKRRSKLSMEDIRRLSTEVVNSVLQTAGDEVKVILQNRDSVTDENKPLNAIDIESNDDPEIILHLQDTEMEFNGIKLDEVSLADIPEEDTLHTFSNMTDISSNNVTTSIAMKNIPVGSKHSIDRIEVTDEIDFDTQCGFGPFKPQCIQRYATANVYVILYSIIGILHGSYYTYLVGVLTTLEKRFEFKSKTSGFIMILDELTPLFLGVLVGHFGGRAHRPRLLSFGMFLSAFCCFASALPYFLYGTATHLSSIDSVHNKTRVEMCNGDVRIEHCDEDDRPPTLAAILLLMLGSFLKGFGNLAYYAIGLAYLDDNAKKRNTPLYFAVAFALRLLGPMVGFLMSSAFLKYYENPFETPDFGPEDPRWIGGWWMGFMLQGVLLLIFAGPMALFPRRLPDHMPMMHEIEHNSKSMFDGLGDSLKRLARNPLYMLLGLNAIFTVYGNFGYYIMLPKYMENQFRLSASSASLFAGPPGIAALMVSCIVGGYLIWKFKPTAKLLAGGLVTLELISTVGYLILMIPGCEKIEMTHFGVGDESLILENECNMNCNCSTVSFNPVCGPDGKSLFFSPCYAGCSYQQDQSFYNCSCGKGENAVVTKGFCNSQKCWSQALAYIVTLPVLQFIVNILRVAYTMIMLRSIKPEDKNIALGVFETVLSTIAFIPFPVLYGALVDSACLVWEKSCGETGNCWFYDIQKFNYLIHGGSAFFCGLSTLVLIAIFFLANRIQDLYKDEEEDTEDSRKAKTNVK